jgi:hypothetical protein
MADQNAIPAQEATPADLQAATECNLVPATSDEAEPAASDSPQVMGSTSPSAAPAQQKAKGLRKKRTLTSEEFGEYGKQLAEMAQAGRFPGQVLSVADVADALNVAQHLVDRIINESCLMGKGFSISRTPAKTPSDNTCRIDPRGMCTIPRSFFEKLNNSLPQEKQFSPGDELTCTPDGDGFTVTRADSSSPTN